MNPALHRPSPDSAILVYVDYVTGLDNLMNRLPTKVYKNNVAAFAKMNPLFKMPTVVFGEENEYYGTFLPEMAHVTHDIRRYNRTSISGYIPEFAEWLASTGRIGAKKLFRCRVAWKEQLDPHGTDVHECRRVGSAAVRRAATRRRPGKQLYTRAISRSS